MNNFIKIQDELIRKDLILGIVEPKIIGGTHKYRLTIYVDYSRLRFCKYEFELSKEEAYKQYKNIVSELITDEIAIDNSYWDKWLAECCVGEKLEEVKIKDGTIIC